ncbi:hypothetical protein GNP80_01170 [Aliivibrio fischeri]|uniref:cytochrome-c peroxidase n=1 Tax=Aliivibrio fischeri TaxID=668 RepID=UPI0012D99AA8|nr:cytochrome c peroxidase [Aliivibrio fischeri]MUK91057.1 hypothetical protein [Aliivibrio fischeri]
MKMTSPVIFSTLIKYAVLFIILNLFILFFIQSNPKPILNANQENILYKVILDNEKRVSKEIKIENKRAKLGEDLFNDIRLSKYNNISCASCHDPNNNFQDTHNITKKTTNKNIKAPSLRGVHQQDWFFWDGRVDSLWSQSLEAIKNEHQLSMQETIDIVCQNYAKKYADLLSFCHTNDSEIHKYKQIGELIASYIQTIEHVWTRFDEFGYQYKKNQQIDPKLLSYDEIEGFKLFIDREKTGCIDCHSDERFSNDGFYAIGTGNNAQSDRISGIKKYLSSPYTCEQWNKKEACLKYYYMRKEGDDLVGALKVPSLRNLHNSSHFMHDLRFSTLESVIHHYMYPTGYMHDYVDIKPLRLTPIKRKHLIAFLKALNEPYSL